MLHRLSFVSSLCGSPLPNGLLLQSQSSKEEPDISLTFRTGLKIKKLCNMFTIVFKEREPINSDTGSEKKVLPNAEIEPEHLYCACFIGYLALL